jgi:hypothetical protein
MHAECLLARFQSAILVIALFTSALVYSQTPQAPNLEPNRPERPRVPTVTFTFNWPSIEPHRYVITIDSSGNAAYQSWMSDATAEQSVAGDPYMLKFTVSASTRDRIFALVPQLNYFNADFEYRKHRVAATGDKTLAYADPDKQYQTKYNWSENQGIRELTDLFQGISTTIETGRRLERLRRFDPLGLDAELKSLENLAVEHRALELQVIAPVLQQLADDPRVMNIARQSARHILRLAWAAPGTGATTSGR